MHLDVLAFGPHPDDVELSMGGTLLRLAGLGYKTGIIDLTSGENATRGTPDVRAREAEDAARILRAEVRRNLDLGDGRLEASQGNKLAVAQVLREYRPSLVFTNFPENNHPDHTASGSLVAEAAYLAGLKKLDLAGEPHRPNRVLYYFVPHKTTPSFIVDVSEFYDAKLEAIRAHRTQMFDPESKEPATTVSAPEFLSRIEGIDRYYGALIDANFGEAFYLREAIEVSDPVKLFDRPFTRIT
jgi:bacillithiol biosynthesis deacetylase BshB1